MDCKVCGDRRRVLLPVQDDDGGHLEERPCPCCEPWPDGFGGLAYKIGPNQYHMVIQPAAAGERAIYNGPPSPKEQPQ